MINTVKGDYNTVLEEKGFLTFVPNGNSMWPFIKNRSQTVIIKNVEKPLKKFDVVLYKRADGSYVLHRIVDIDGDEIITQGDSQFYTEKVATCDVVGVMTDFYKGKKLVDANDKKYLNKVEKWYKNGLFTRLRKKAFALRLRVKSKFKRIFKGA